MPAKLLGAEEIGPLRIAVPEPSDAGAFAFSSHRRAREALAFGLSLDEPGFNIFVVGEDRSGRMTATLEYLHNAVSQRSPPDDWVYLNNLHRPHRPRPLRMPAGTGRRFRDRMAALIPGLRDLLGAVFGDEGNRSRNQHRR